MDLSKEELEEELQAIKESIEAHEAQKELHIKMLRRENLLRYLVNKELEKFK